MSYKTILVHIEPTLRPDECVKVAAQLAKAEQAHLLGAATTGWSPLVLSGAGLDPSIPPFSAQFDVLRRDAERALEAFEQQARALGVASVETRLVEDEPGAGLAALGRYADLIVVGQTRGEAAPASPLRKDFPEYLLLNSARPLLVIPVRGSFDVIGARMLVGWNGSPEASRAITSAMSLLRQAESVIVLIVNPRMEGVDEGRVAGADIRQYLGRHGVHAEVVTKEGQEHDLELLDALSEYKADMLVMGAYGHSRLREYLLGGATRTMLRSMTVPVWMMH